MIPPSLVSPSPPRTPRRRHHPCRPVLASSSYGKHAPVPSKLRPSLPSSQIWHSRPLPTPMARVSSASHVLHRDLPQPAMVRPEGAGSSTGMAQIHGTEGTSPCPPARGGGAGQAHKAGSSSRLVSSTRRSSSSTAMMTHHRSRIADESRVWMCDVQYWEVPKPYEGKARPSHPWGGPIQCRGCVLQHHCFWYPHNVKMGAWEYKFKLGIFAMYEHPEIV